VADHLQSTPHTVEFDVSLEDGQHVGSMITWALPNPGDLLRVDEVGKQPVYQVVRNYFEPDNLTVVVKPSESEMPTAASSESPFSRQEPGAGGFQ
jgi:hypothetical protein